MRPQLQPVEVTMEEASRSAAVLEYRKAESANIAKPSDQMVSQITVGDCQCHHQFLDYIMSSITVLTYQHMKLSEAKLTLSSTSLF
jgi:hypothetical protein